MRYKAINVFVHILVWVGAYAVMGYFFDIEPLSKFQILLFLLYGSLLNILMTYSYAHVSLPKFIRSPKVSYLVGTNLAYLFGISVLEGGLDYLFFLPYLGENSGYFNNVVSSYSLSNYLTFLTWNLPLNAGMLLAANFYGFSYNYFQVKKAKSEIEKEKLKAELSALKHQINPHFLFNVLNTLYGMAFENDDEPTANGIAKLSNMMRYMLYESNDDHVPLEKEIDYLKNYITLQKLRVNDAVVVDFVVRGEPSGHYIPPMIFLPFVENAFKHGISLVHPSRISIEIDIEPKGLRFQVENSKHPPNQSGNRQQGGIGLQNVKKRLNLLCKHHYRLQIDDQEDLFSVDLHLEFADLRRKKIPVPFVKRTG